MFTRKALAGAITFGVAAVAVAAPSVAGATEFTKNSAFALSATGLLKIDPVPHANGADGFDQKSLAEFSLPGQLVKLNLLNAQAGGNKAAASIKDVSVSLDAIFGGGGKPQIAASALEAHCKAGEGASSLAKANIGGIKLDVAAAPNTKVGIDGLASVTVNKQVKHKDGSFTVTALSVSVDGIQTLDLASATCVASSGGDTSTPPTEPTKPGKPSTPGKPSATKPSAPTTSTGSNTPGDKPTSDGKAPTPTPAKAHLDVTG